MKFFNKNLLDFSLLWLQCISVSFMRNFRDILRPFEKVWRARSFSQISAHINVHRNYSDLSSQELGKNMSSFSFTCVSVLGSSWTGPGYCISTWPVSYTSASESPYMWKSQRTQSAMSLCVECTEWILILAAQNATTSLSVKMYGMAGALQKDFCCRHTQLNALVFLKHAGNHQSEWVLEYHALHLGFT